MAAAANAAAIAALQVQHNAESTIMQDRITQLESLLGGVAERQQREAKETAAMQTNMSLVAAQNLFPQRLSDVMEKKMQFPKDAFTRSRVGYATLCKDDLQPADIEVVKTLLGEIYRLSNNELVGAEVSKQISHQPLSFVDVYTAETRSIALQPVAETWGPEAQLVKYDDKVKSSKKAHEVAVARNQADNANRKRQGTPLNQPNHLNRLPGYNGPPGGRFPNGPPGGHNIPPPPPGAPPHGRVQR